MKRPVLALCAAVALLVGCGTKATEYPLAASQRNQPQPPLEPDPNRPLIAIAFSGGGSRAAALAAVVVDQLNRVTYRDGDQTRTLGSDIAVASSVSGGSVYNADLGLHGPAHARAFAERIQSFDGIGWLAQRAFNPFTWIGLQLKGETRVDEQQRMLEVLLDTNATMAALNRAGQPLVLMNASDLIAGQVFTFDRATMDDLCFDYDKVPVSLGANASAAVPVAYTPVLLHNNSYVAGGCPGARNTNQAYRTMVQQPGAAYANLEAFRAARYRQALRDETVKASGGSNTIPPARNPEYVRLVDGGVVDNSALTGLRRALLSIGAPADIGRLVAQKKLRNLVVIVVNARADSPNPLDKSPAYTTILDIAGGSVDALIDSAAGQSASLFKVFTQQLAEERNAMGATFNIYPVTIDFDQLPIATSDERAEQQAVKTIATSWTLPPGTVDLLDRVAGKLLWRDPCFNALAKEIGLTGNRQASPVPNVVCPVAQPIRKRS